MEEKQIPKSSKSKKKKTENLSQEVSSNKGPTIDKNKYLVKKGDTLSSIASKHLLDKNYLYARNKFIIGNNPDNIKEGQILNID